MSLLSTGFLVLELCLWVPFCLQHGEGAGAALVRSSSCRAVLCSVWAGNRCWEKQQLHTQRAGPAILAA